MKTIHTVAVNGEQYSILDAHAVERAAKALCPAFRESGRVVQCEPMPVCPLRVTTQLQQEQTELTLTNCGKNLFDYTKYPFERMHYLWESGGRISSNGFCAPRKLIPVGHLKGKTITLNHAPVDKNGNAPGLCFYTAGVPESPDAEHFIPGAGGNGHTYVVPEEAEYMGFSVPNEYLDGTQIQIELGDAVTEHEPYRGQTYQATPESLTHDWGEIPAMEGVNTLFSSGGTLWVEGCRDLISLIGKLTGVVNAHV